MAASEEELPSLEQAILAFLRQQEDVPRPQPSVEGEEESGQQDMGFPEDFEPRLAAAKAEVLKQGPALAAGGREAVKNLTPFALQICGSYLAYNAGLGIFQLAGLGMRVSCNSRLWGPCLGCIGVGVASALAGHASRRVRKGLASGRPLVTELVGTPPWQDWHMEQALLDALVGVSAFKLLGGEFRRIMPSDLRFPGAFAKGSMPTTRSAKDDSTAYLQHGPNRVHLEKMLIKDGCHSCGKRGGGLHADHMPPNKLYKQAKAEAERQASAPHRVFLNKATGKLPKPWRNRARELVIRLTDSEPPTQHFYPHCTSCSNKQGQLLGNGSRGPLVLHRLGVPPGPLPGILAGFRFLTTLQVPPTTPGPQGGRSSGPRGKGANKGRQQQQQQQQQSAFPFSLLGCAPPLQLPSTMQGSAARPPSLLVRYEHTDSDEEECAGRPPALVLSVAEQQQGSATWGNGAGSDLWAFAVRITPEDLAGTAEEALQQSSTRSAEAFSASCSYSTTGLLQHLDEAGAAFPPTPTAASPCAESSLLLGSTLCASPAAGTGCAASGFPATSSPQQPLGVQPSAPVRPRELARLHPWPPPQHHRHQQQQQQQQQHHHHQHQHQQHQQQAALDQWDDVAWPPDATTPWAAKRSLQSTQASLHDAAATSCLQSKAECALHAWQGGSSSSGGADSSVAASTCKPRHTLSPALQAVLAELLKSSTGADMAAGQQRPRVAEQQQQQQQQHTARPEGSSPRSKPLYAHVQAHSQQLQQQWQHEQMLRHWRVHH